MNAPARWPRGGRATPRDALGPRRQVTIRAGESVKPHAGRGAGRLNSKMAAAERIDRGYLGRMLQLTLLAPDIVEATLDGRHAAELGLPKLMRPFPVDWRGQRTAFAKAAHREPPWDALAGAEPERRTARCRRAGTARLA